MRHAHRDFEDRAWTEDERDGAEQDAGYDRGPGDDRPADSRGTLLVGPRAAAQSHAERQNECSNRTLRGSYAFAINGTIIAGPNRLVLRALAMTEFDGSGNLTQVDFSTIDGVPTGTDWRPAVGSYEVDANCTGTMQIIPSVGPTLNLKLVVADHGRTVHNVVLGNATGAIGTKVD